MDEHTATEQAYKNGYEAGIKDFAERLKECASDVLLGGTTKCRMVTTYLIDRTLTELTERKEDEE